MRLNHIGMMAEGEKGHKQQFRDNRLFSYNELVYDERTDKGLVAVWAYHCYRCGYIWLPKDYDVSNINTLAREPPKSCARCKSKYWNRHPIHSADDKKYNRSVTRRSAQDREVRRNQSPEERERFDKLVKSFVWKVRRDEKSKSNSLISQDSKDNEE